MSGDCVIENSVSEKHNEEFLRIAATWAVHTERISMGAVAPTAPKKAAFMDQTFGLHFDLQAKISV